MYRTKSRKVAQELACEHNLLFGHCVFDGMYYVGTHEKLRKIGVIIDKECEHEV